MNAFTPSDLTSLSMTEAADAFAQGEVTAEALGARLARPHRRAWRGGERGDPARPRRGAGRGGRRRQGPRRRRQARQAGWRADDAQGHVLPCRPGEHLRLEDSAASSVPPPSTATVLQRLDAAGARSTWARMNMAEFAQNPTGHNAHLRRLPQPVEPGYTAPAVPPPAPAAGARRPLLHRGAGLRYRRLDPPAGDALRRHRAEGDADPRLPPRRHAAELLGLDNVGPLVRTARDRGALPRLSSPAATRRTRPARAEAAPRTTRWR